MKPSRKGGGEQQKKKVISYLGREWKILKCKINKMNLILLIIANK